MHREWHAEILIVGASFGGVSAALAAARAGRRVVLTEETGWIGGQATAQGVPLDEHPWIPSATVASTAAQRRRKRSSNNGSRATNLALTVSVRATSITKRHYITLHLKNILFWREP